MMNNVTLMGRIANDLELKQTQNGKAVISFAVAIDRNTKEKITDFIPCKAWEKTAELIDRYFNKGDMIAIEGSLFVNKAKDKDGNNRTFYEVNANRVHFCGNKTQATAQPTQNATAAVDIADDDLPF